LLTEIGGELFRDGVVERLGFDQVGFSVDGRIQSLFSWRWGGRGCFCRWFVLEAFELVY